jgi:Fur family transcriptional regulator, ferric uptake regulator
LRKRCGWSEKLTGCGFRLTKAREVIIEVLKNTKEHLSAEDIYMTMHQEYPEIGLTTVYRTLEVLHSTGIVDKFDFDERRARFELSEEFGSKKHHHHLICTKCQKIVDYFDFMDEEINYLEIVTKGLSKKYDFNIKGHLISFHGICSNCK